MPERSADSKMLLLSRSYCQGTRKRSVKLDSIRQLFVLVVPMPECVIEAKHAKSKREDTIPINSGLVTTLKAWRKLRTKELGRRPKANERVVRVPRHLGNDQFRKDCAYAEIPTKNERGHILDLYAATRHTFCTLLGQEIMPPHKQRLLMRHRHLATTERYTHFGTQDLVEGCERLPDFPEFEGLENVAIIRRPTHSIGWSESTLMSRRKRSNRCPH